MKQTFRTARNVLAVMMAVLLVALTASVAATAAEVDKVILFVNEFATDSVNPSTDLTVYKEEIVQEYSVPAGTQIYNASEGAPENAIVFDKTPTRSKDADFGKYNFVGWATKTGEGNDAVYTVVDFPYQVDEDATLYAKFEGEQVQYTIDFRSDGVFVDADGALQPDIIKVPVINPETNEQEKDPYTGELLFVDMMNENPREPFTVNHGGSIAPPANNPTRPDSDHYEFHFSHWDYDYTHIYKGGSINAVYDMVGKTYKFRFLDYNGDELGEREVQYGTACNDVPAVPNRQFSTNEKQYSFHDEWNLAQDGSGEKIDMKNIKFQDAVEDKNGFINVYANYRQKLNEYYFTLHIIDSDGEEAEGVGVQVAGPDNQLLTVFRDETLGHNGGVGTTDENGIVTLSVPYAEYYTVSAYDPYYNLAVQTKLTLDDIKGEAQITLQLREPYDLNKGNQRCGDICHTFFGGMWITGMNLFYRLFKVKYVCCYDMYAVHGSRLAYASGSPGRTIDRS